jgi:pimeloyl-ACP methyl ester carboxylesterase
MASGERMVRANDVDICVETFGAPTDPAVLLIHGASASMLWWEEELCERVAAAGRHVIRFDHRDTGRSTCYPAGRPEYALRDMASDALGVLDALGVERAHAVGRSMGGAIALLAARQARSLTLVTTSPGLAELSPMTPEFLGFFAAAGAPDAEDVDAVTEFIVGLNRAYSGPSPYFDEDHIRDLAVRDVQRARSIPATLANHFVIDTSGDPIDFAAVAVPTLVVHGAQDPTFPLDHGQHLADHIPGAELLVLEKAGHELPSGLWDVFVERLVAHTAD